MGVFSSMYTDTYINENDYIEPVEEAGIEAALAVVVESENNFNAIMQAIGINELAVLESTGENMIYEASDNKGFFAKFKEFLLNIIKKIAGIFKKFIAMLDSWTKSDKDFVTKYEKQLKKVDTRDFKFNGYKFTINRLPMSEDAYKNCFDVQKVGNVITKNASTTFSLPKFENVNKMHVDAAKAYDEDKYDIIENMRSYAIGGTSSFTAAEFADELFEMARNGESSTTELELKDVGDVLGIINNLKNAESEKKEATKDYTNFEKTIRQIIRGVEAKEKEAGKLDERGRYGTGYPNGTNGTKSDMMLMASTAAKIIKDALAIAQTVNGARLTALKDRNRQAKSICVKLLTYKPTHESFDHYNDDDDSFLSNVHFR